MTMMDLSGKQEDKEGSSLWGLNRAGEVGKGAWRRDGMRWCDVREGRPGCMRLTVVRKRASHMKWGPKHTQWMDGLEVIHSFGENNFMDWKGKTWDQEGL